MARYGSVWCYLQYDTLVQVLVFTEVVQLYDTSLHVD